MKRVSNWTPRRRPFARRAPCYDGFAAEGADLGAADVEDVAQAGKIRQGEVAGGAGEGVAEAGAVDEERQSVLMGNGLQFSEFRAGVDRPVFRRQGNVYEAGPDHVVLVRVCDGGGKEGFQFARVHFSVMLGKRQDLMPGVLDGAGLMDGDVARLYGNGTFIVRKQGGDDGGVGLGAAHEEMDFAIGAGAGLENLPLGALGVRVAAVAVQLFEVGLDEPLENLRMGPFRVIASEKNHDSLSWSCKGSKNKRQVIGA